MAIIQEIKSLLDSPEFPYQLEKLSNLFCDKTLIPEVTCWGGRVLRVQGTRESIPLQIIANKFSETVFKATDETDQDIRDLMQAEKDGRLGEVIKYQCQKRHIDFHIAAGLAFHLRGRYDSIDDQIAQSNLFVRILAAIRRFFPSEYGAYHDMIYIDDKGTLAEGTFTNSLCIERNIILMKYYTNEKARNAAININPA